MKGGPTIPLEELRAVLDDVTPHLSAVDGGIAAAASAGPALRRLYAMAGLRLVKVSDEQEPCMEAAG